MRHFNEQASVLTSMFPIWLQDAQPGRARYQQKLVGPT